jgi:dihydrodipicolinate synthase/N-acetylneuraminate lyase
MRNFGLPGYTTGSGCIGASWTQQMFTHCSQGQWEEAATLRERFIPLEDIRDAQGPARVLHAATEAAGIAQTGPVPPFVTALGPEWNVALAEAVKPLA